MHVKNVLEFRAFSPRKLCKTTLFQSERMFCDVHAFSEGQEQKAHMHEDSDKIYYVVEGRGIFKVGGEAHEVGEKNAVYVPAGAAHSVRNDSGGTLTLLVLMAPHPNYVSKEIER